MGSWVLVVALAYGVADAAIGRRVLSRLDPWWAALVYLGPVAVVFQFDLGSEAFRAGVGAYISGAMVLAGAMRYGGCEVIALPLLISRRRYAAYCPWNAWDAAERPLLHLMRKRGSAGALILVFTVATAAYFYAGEAVLVITTGGTASWLDLLGLALLAPAALLAVLGAQERRREGDAARRQAFDCGLGAFWLALLGINFAFGLDWFWAAALVGGIMWAVGLSIVERRRSGARVVGGGA